MLFEKKFAPFLPFCLIFVFRLLSLFQKFRLFLAILTYIWPFFTGRHPELSSPSHLSHPSQQAGNNRNLGLFSHFYDGQRQQSHFPRTSGEVFFKSSSWILGFWTFWLVLPNHVLVIIKMASSSVWNYTMK